MTDQTTPRVLDPKGLAESFRRRAWRGPERPALSFGDETLSYGELLERSERLSAVLAAGGVGAGDRVAYLGLNHPACLEMLLAAARLGAIFIPLNFRFTGPELEYVLNDAGAHTLLAGPEHTAVIDSVADKLGGLRRLVNGPDAPAGWESLDGALGAAPTVPPAVDGAPDDVVLLIYTSGTTGRPKGAMLTNQNLFTSSLNWVLCSDFCSTDVALNVAPLFHVGGLNVVTLPTLLTGGHVVLQAAFDPVGLLRAVERHGVTITFMVPAMMLAAMRAPESETFDLSSLRLVVAGGAPCPEPVLKAYAGRGIPVSQCYGMTEATCGVAFLDTARALERLGSCGRPGMLNDLRLVDFDGRPVTEPHVKGEVCMKGGNVTKGYWNDPVATAAAIDADGWLHSGDVGYFDEDGFLYLCDRVKDMVISGGENVYPAEVESVLYDHPAVAEVAVIGRPDEQWGERVVAVAALRPGEALTLDGLQAFAGERLARYKLPRELHIVDALPRNSNGKVVKTELRQRYGS